MTKKSLILGALLSVSTLCFAGAKAYDVSFAAPATVGNVQLPAGDYKVKVEGANAVFTSTRNSKSTSMPVKVETAAKKFVHTAVDATKEGAGERINSIQLGGSTTTLDFVKQPATGASLPSASGSQF
jgi:hypothetical protein